MNIYEAQNDALTQWKYRGPLFELPDAGAPTVECPNFFELDGQWVLFVSPYGRVQYFIGDFDARTCRFTARKNGFVDFGSTFYAPNTMMAPAGRRLVWGWLSGFPPNHGWNGCLSLPRQLTLSADGNLQQAPAPELRKLRGAEVKAHRLRLSADASRFMLPATNTVEIEADIHFETSIHLALKLSDRPEDVVQYDPGRSSLSVGDLTAPLALDQRKHLKLHIFIDRTILEIFANDRVCLTRTIPLIQDRELRLFADAGGASASVRAWPIHSIW